MHKNTDGKAEVSDKRRRAARTAAVGASLLLLALLIIFAVVKVNSRSDKKPEDVAQAGEASDKGTPYDDKSTGANPKQTASASESKTDNTTDGIGITTAESINTATEDNTEAEPTRTEPSETRDKPTEAQAQSSAAQAEQTQPAEPKTEAVQSAAPTTKPTAAPTKPNEPTAEPTNPSVPATEAAKPITVEDKARYYISQMTVEEKVAGLFFVHPEVINGGLTADGSTREALSRYPVGGIIYFGNNIQSEQQLSSLLAQTKAYSKYPLFLGVDEEGGKVARVAQAFESVENTGDASALGALNNPEAAYSAYRKIGEYLGKYGFNVDFAPVADIYNENNSMFEKRSFGKDEKLVSDYVYRSVKGLRDSGISACAKHFPGHGNAKGDSHSGMAVSLLTREELLEHELLPFKSAVSAGTDFIMMGHISLPNILPDDTPSTLSYDIVTGILREKLGYDGIIITDAMRMSAVSEIYSSAEAAVMAIKAGCDMVLMPVDFNEAYQGVLNAVKSGEIPLERIEASLMRIYRVKCRNM
ncbi:MAG: beta-N-acetylhexosaminidase [Butyrivibrio sp.]|nr:beta-N-acetylhexosaminidase [Butyrivibrio sp.]